MPMRSSVRMTRQAMAPRLAMRTLPNMSGSRRAPDPDLDGRGVIGVAGVVQLRAGRDQRDDIHMRGQLDIFAGGRKTVGELQSAVRRDRHVHEEIDVVGDVTR